MNDNNLDLQITRLTSVTRAKIWRAWSDPVMLAEWWCPKPWKTTVRGFDMRPGGTFDTLMTGPNGETSDNPGCFLEIVPAERIVMTSMLTANWRPASPWLPMTGIFTMTDEGTGTRYTARALHNNAEDAKKHADMGFEEGWGICAAQLESFARTLT